MIVSSYSILIYGEDTKEMKTLKRSLCRGEAMRVAGEYISDSIGGRTFQISSNIDESNVVGYDTDRCIAYTCTIRMNEM